MRGGAKAILVRFVNDSPIDLRTHFRTSAEEIIDTQFDDVGLVANQFVDAFSRLFRSLDGDSPGNNRGILYQSGDIQTRGRPWKSFSALFPQIKFFGATQAEDCGNAVAQ